MVKKQEAQSPDIFIVKFADAKIPVFKEMRNRDFVKYGEDNNYPEYLNYLFNKSAKHNAIITGKARYIFGQGYTNGDQIINRIGDTLNDIAKKAILDTEIYGGYRLEIIWNSAGKIAEIYHIDYSCMRKGKDEGFYYKETWEATNRDEEEYIPGFNPSKPIGSQIFAYNEYRPGVRFYPLPSYIGCNNYIETDIEISKFHLSSIRNAFMPSKLVEFISGELPDEKKKEIERRWTNKFTGSENAGKFIFATASSKEKSINITDLSANDLDKQFDILNQTCQQEIFSGHNVTSPMLFGIKTEGQLGGSNELATAYEIFKNTYAIPKAQAFDKEMTYLMSYSKMQGKYELKSTDPIGLQFDVKDVINALPKVYVFDKLGIPKEQWDMPNIGQDNRPSDNTKPVIPLDTIPGPEAPAIMSNDNIKNLTAKQHQQLLRIIRQHAKGQLTTPAAKALLRTGLGLSDDDINNLLGIQAAMSKHDDVIAMFAACGEDKGDYEIMKSKRVSFASDDEAADDEINYIQDGFKLFDPTKSEKAILDAVKENPSVTVTEIADRTGTSEDYVNSKIRGLISEGYLEGEIGSLLVPPRIGNLIDTANINPVQIFVKYSYEGPVDSRNRPFCAKMMSLNRLYTRYDIERISQRLGYSVFDRRGGFWNDNGVILDHCRHNWKSNVVIKRGGNA